MEKFIILLWQNFRFYFLCFVRRRGIYRWYRQTSGVGKQLSSFNVATVNIYRSMNCRVEYSVLLGISWTMVHILCRLWGDHVGAAHRIFAQRLASWAVPSMTNMHYMPWTSNVTLLKVNRPIKSSKETNKQKNKTTAFWCSCPFGVSQGLTAWSGSIAKQSADSYFDIVPTQTPLSVDSVSLCFFSHGALGALLIKLLKLSTSSRLYGSLPDICDDAYSAWAHAPTSAVHCGPTSEL